MSYATLRTLHGLLALALGALLVVYCVSGWMIIHGVGGGAAPPTNVRVAAEAVGGETEDASRVRAVASAAAVRAGLANGSIKRTAFADGAWRVSIARIARSAEVTLTPGAAEARVALRDAGFGGSVKRLHHSNAVKATGWRLAWGLWVDALAIALLVFALSGTLLFRALKRRRRLGWVLLGASSLYTIGGIAWLALSR